MTKIMSKNTENYVKNDENDEEVMSLSFEILEVIYKGLF